MSKDKLFIPEDIHIGFQKRGGTYTGKLAYIIYTDAKGKKRKEKSWNSWRNSSIAPEDFKNEPTSGFVLNKKVGGDRYGWNPRATYVRVWDPRDFEFEISVPNLLFILQETSAIKGKGLEGEFVYSWDGQDLVLLPVGCEEYKKSSQHTENQHKKITKEDMVEGCMYLTKEGEEVMYLGRHTIYANGSNSKYMTCKKKHVFWSKDQRYENNVVIPGSHKYYAKTNYRWESGYTKLSDRLTDTPAADFPEKYDTYKKTFKSFEFKEIVEDGQVDIYKEFCKTNYINQVTGFVKKDGEYYSISVREGNQYDWYHDGKNSSRYGIFLSEEFVKFKKTSILVPEIPWYFRNRHQWKPLTKTELDSLNIVKLAVKTTDNEKLKIKPNVN